MANSTPIAGPFAQGVRARSRAFRLPYPREHGAWGMLIAGGALAWAHPSVWGWPAAVLLALFLLAFAIQEPLRAVFSGRKGPWWAWIAGYGTLLVAGAAWLIIAHDLIKLVPAVALGVVLTAADLLARRHGLHRKLIVRLGGGAVLTLILPGSLCLLHPQMHAYAIVLWGMTLAYFLTRMLFVRERLGSRQRPQPALRRAALVSQAVLYVGVGALVVAGLAGPLAFAAFAPATVATVLRPSAASPRRIGLAEAAYLTWFVVLLVLSFHGIGLAAA